MTATSLLAGYGILALIVAIIVAGIYAINAWESKHKDDEHPVLGA